MAQKEIDLLRNQIDKLNVKGFDLEAWKKYTIVIVARIFGEHSEKIRQIEKITYDYSSWALRDTTGSSEYLETCKKLGREILEASIDELKTFGLPAREQATNEFYNIILSALQDELKGSQMKEIRQILEDDTNKETIIEKLKSYGTEVAPSVLASILCDPLFIKELRK
ncbi:MAG: hypothetical protein KKA81_15520 [Bacteroidetes bacterium]|nr:hypothetical protein [Bacteroidota bacterium]